MPRGARPPVISQQLRRLDWVVDLAFTCIPILEIISYSYYPRYRCLICLSPNYVISPSVIFEFICIHFISILTHQGCHRQQTTWSGCRIGLRHIKSSNRTNENCETKNFTRAQIQPPKRNSVILYGAHAGCYQSPKGSVPPRIMPLFITFRAFQCSNTGNSMETISLSRNLLVPRLASCLYSFRLLSCNEKISDQFMILGFLSCQKNWTIIKIV